jgi:predicted nicotinamide N-methyase
MASPLRSGADPRQFILDHTALLAPPLVPEISLYQASEITPIWEATEAALEEMGLPPPFWAFAWAGGQALARWLLDNPGTVAGKRVLDLGSGSGLAAIAAAKAGAASVVANEIDAVAAAAIALNAEANDVSVDILIEDLVGGPNRWDAILAGDVCYEQQPAARIVGWLREMAREVPVWLGDPNRTYLPTEGLEPVVKYAVQTTREIEDTDVRNARVWRVLPETDKP